MQLQPLLMLERQHVAATVSLLGAGTAAVVALDVLLVPDLSLVVLFLPIVLLAAWRVGFWFGCLSAVVAGLSHLSAASLGGVPLPAAASASLSWSAVFCLLSWMTLFLRRLSLAQRHSGRVDSLTGLLNRTGLFERAEAEMNRSRRSGRPLTVVFVDCDDFKAVNDKKGHLAGDELLKRLGGTLISVTRSYDVTARIGGDEFVAVLPETASEQAQSVVGRLQRAMLQAIHEDYASVTLSIGVATFDEPPGSVEELIHAADEQMYAVKRAGKDGIRFTTLGAAAPAT